jgi:hypothetical protein
MAKRVFISWSGERSNKIAQEVKKFIFDVLRIESYVSSEDIHSGERWAKSLFEELASSYFGIVCLTPENLRSIWMHFEAGACSKAVNEARVIPLLCGVRNSQLEGPLGHFQAKPATESGLRKVLADLNRVSEEQRLPDDQFTRAFDKWWPETRVQLEKILSQPPTAADFDSNIADPGAVIDYPRQGDLVPRKIEVRGRFTNPLPQGYELRLLRGYSDGSFVPNGTLYVDHTRRTWSAQQFDVAGEPGSVRTIEIWLVGFNGRALLDNWLANQQVVSVLHDELKNLGKASKTWLPSIKVATTDMMRCHQIEVVRS